MFGIGWSELAVILCVAIIFIQPRDLPKLFRRLGKLYAQVKKAYAEITATKDQLVKDIEAAAALEEGQEKASSAKVGEAGVPSTAAPDADSTVTATMAAGETGTAKASNPEEPQTASSAASK